MWPLKKPCKPSFTGKTRLQQLSLVDMGQVTLEQTASHTAPNTNSSTEIPLHRQKFNQPSPEKLEIKPVADKIGRLLAGYYRTSTLVIIAAFFYFVVWLLTLAASPRLFANWLFADSYLLIQMLLFGGNFFLFTFIAQNRHVGLWLAAVIWAVLFFHLAHFRLTFPLVLSLVLLAAIWWYLLVYRRHPATPKTNETVQTDGQND